MPEEEVPQGDGNPADVNPPEPQETTSEPSGDRIDSNDTTDFETEQEKSLFGGDKKKRVFKKSVKKPEDPRKYASISGYVRFLRKGSKRATTIKPGMIFAYRYHPIKSTPWKKLRFYDKVPLVFVVRVDRTTGHFWGINFHHMSIRARQFWFDKLIRRYKTIEKGVNYQVRTLDYNGLFRFMPKSVLAYRTYKIDSVRDFRFVPYRTFDEALKYYANTYFGSTYIEVASRYDRSRPPKPPKR